MPGRLRWVQKRRSTRLSKGACAGSGQLSNNMGCVRALVFGPARIPSTEKVPSLQFEKVTSPGSKPGAESLGDMHSQAGDVEGSPCCQKAVPLPRRDAPTRRGPLSRPACERKSACHRWSEDRVVKS